MSNVQYRQRFLIWLGVATTFFLTVTSAGASISCYDCHGTRSAMDFRPTDAPYRNITTGGFQGTHRNHLAIGANATSCTKCHPGSDSYTTSHRDGVIGLSSNIKNSPQAATYKNSTTPFPQTSTPSLGTCTNVNCHFEKETPVWGGAVLTLETGCGACHDTPPADGNHPAASGPGKKHGDYYGTGSGSCGICHVSHFAGANPFSHATSVGRNLILSFNVAPNSGGGYGKPQNLSYPNYLPSRTRAEDRNGSCSNLYCHSDGQEGAPKTTPTWGATFASSCNSCHDSAGDTTNLSGRHGKHTGSSGYAYSCERCHKTTANGSDTIADKASHVNKNKDVSFREGGNYGSEDKSCNAYCHSNADGGAPTFSVKWTDTAPMQCYSCHKGRTQDNTPANCADTGGVWNSDKGFCAPYVNITSNGHSRLVGPQWIRRYPCTYCHNATIDANGNIIDKTRHTNGVKDVSMGSQWAIVGRSAPVYDAANKICDNVYCHSDGTTNPEDVRPFAWTAPKTDCNSCHGHPSGTCSNTLCHDGRTDSTGKVWTAKAGWPAGQEWKAATPMFPNQGSGSDRANSHQRHADTNFTCDQCHTATITNGICTDCHATGIPLGSMSEVSHLNGSYHVNKAKDVVFKQGGSYNPVTKTCSNTACHSGGTDPQWGSSVNTGVICLTCHGTTSPDVDSFGFKIYSTQARINLTEWATTGHGRPISAGPYPASGNPAANFPGNPCWYCHDNNILHNDTGNPFRLRQHDQYTNRFEKECVYCHMIGLDSECLSCHDNDESLAPQLASLPADPSTTWPDGSVAPRPDHRPMSGGGTSCLTTLCHFVDPASPTNDMKRHNAGAGIWTADQKGDVKNQYLMMGVCLKCHDDDTGGKCNSCHSAPANKPLKYSLGFRPFSSAEYRFIKPQKARASSVHFGYKHNRAYVQDGVWKGGKFCWDCHDPHGDGNIFMIQNKVATSTEGTFGIPKTRADVSFTRKQSGLDYARINAPYNGICNVCHSAGSQHYRVDGGDGHNASRVCTSCHEHRFTDSHADDQPCNTCHQNKPVPRHSGFGLPRDCTKCHSGTIGMRMDIMGQMKANSHHVQGVTVTNKHCYSCHWESTPEGLIDVKHHEGYNYKNYSSAKNAPVDLVVWEPGIRPTVYKLYTTAVSFLASNIGTANERTEVTKLTNVCISCHSDQNNDSVPFNDCKTPRQYAWDLQSVAARYSQQGTVSWGKYNSTTYPGANQKDRVTKAVSAHGNAVANQGGFDAINGLDSSIANTRNGAQNVQCFDCHSSHGSKVVGVTSSYLTFNGTYNGANLKETQAGKGGYAMSYKASANSAAGSINPYNAGAGQCFDCHLNQNVGVTPWGYESTFGATAPIRGYLDSFRFGADTAGYMSRYSYKNMAIKGGHLKSSSFLNNTTAAQNKINGLCTPCHDPHGVSPVLGTKQPLAVPMLKGTWLTSPYREDAAIADTANPPGGQKLYGPPGAYTDQNTFGGARISEDDSSFAGLCLRCHNKSKLTDGINKNQPWKSADRVHESVKGWGANTQHSYSCSKCHAPHTSGMPRLMQTNCLDTRHRGRVASGGQAGSNGPATFEYSNYPNPSSGSFPRGADQYGVNCHPGGAWPDNSWNKVTPW
ncbi:cytochrome c, 37 heme-binding sites [Geotalea daltonii FRC-32]|uniref:Cytochrome c, 37 heme-binding sites n=1 Tax=Geotalea daltonii (strain DSM 22248 / JCM 15807 / FRC-32) TaxID=316067 RepID=B9M3Q4_GEODF|nr:CxxxxCH/CxxCH domain-containing protein [Geotalea daltonii]ACM21475.1 cytochrome c, 37 heme-binding sites [Geotalea daltonii FRC-32]